MPTQRNMLHPAGMETPDSLSNVATELQSRGYRSRRHRQGTRRKLAEAIQASVGRIGKPTGVGSNGHSSDPPPASFAQGSLARQRNCRSVQAIDASSGLCSGFSGLSSFQNSFRRCSGPQSPGPAQAPGPDGRGRGTTSHLSDRGTRCTRRGLRLAPRSCTPRP